MSLALNLPDGGEAELAKIRAEKGIAPSPEPSPQRSDRSGAKQWRNAAKAFADERDRQEALGPKSVDQLLRYARVLAKGDEIDLDELHRATAWTQARFSAALTEARRLDLWPYRPARPKPLPPTPRRNADGMPIWPDPPVRPSALAPPPEPEPEATPPKPTKPDQTPPTPTSETSPMSTATTTTRPMTPPPMPPRPMLYAKGSPPSLSPALRETLTAADAIQVGGKVDLDALAARLGCSRNSLKTRITEIRRKSQWPYESTAKRGRKPSIGTPKPAKPNPEPAPSFPEADTDPAPMPTSTNIVTQIFDAIRPAPTPTSATSLDDIRQLLAAQTAILDDLDGMRPSVRAGVVRWIVDNQASLMGGGA